MFSILNVIICWIFYKLYMFIFLLKTLIGPKNRKQKPGTRKPIIALIFALRRKGIWINVNKLVERYQDVLPLTIILSPLMVVSFGDVHCPYLSPPYPSPFGQTM